MEKNERVNRVSTKRIICRSDVFKVKRFFVQKKLENEIKFSNGKKLKKQTTFYDFKLKFQQL